MSAVDDNPRPAKRVRLYNDSRNLNADAEPPPSSLSTLTESPASFHSSPARPPVSHPASSSCDNTASDSPTKGSKTNKINLKVLPPAALLSSIPGLLIHPPNHKYYVLSLQLSLNALRRCLSLQALSPELECRAWTGLAEVGMRVVSGGFSQSSSEEHGWARGVEAEVCLNESAQRYLS